jgi:hypothetical protein
LKAMKAVYVHDYVHVNVYVNENTPLAIVYVVVDVHVVVDVDVVGFFQFIWRIEPLRFELFTISNIFLIYEQN